MVQNKKFTKKTSVIYSDYTCYPRRHKYTSSILIFRFEIFFRQISTMHPISPILNEKVHYDFIMFVKLNFCKIG